MRRLPIRRKLAVALAVPLAALVVLTVLEVLRTSQDVDEVSEQTELARSSIGPSGIITALQWERSWLSTYLIGQEDSVNVPVEGTEETRAGTDEAIARFQDELSQGNPVVVDAFREAMDGLDRLAEVRRDIDGRNAPRDLANMPFSDSVFDTYGDIIAPFFAATSRVALVVDDPDLRQGAELANTISRQTEAMSLLLNYTISTALSPTGIDEPSEIARVATLHSDFKDYADRLREASGPYAFLARDLFPEALTDRVDEQVDLAISSGTVDLPTILAAVNVPDDEGYLPYQNTLHATITERADDLQSAAEDRQVRFVVIAAITLGAAVALTLLVSQSITRPLRRLTGEAKAMAERRLPDAVLDILDTPLGDDVRVPHVPPVAVKTRDEVADVTVALNTVQDSALDLAVEQAVLRRNIADSFVNLGRRNQSLLGRQLDFITELESNETGPDTLASLFRLDHLATRMRRNAESLLVLAGVEPPRKWAAPVRLTDVIRAALGEVEDYQRVAIRGVEPATVQGAVAADLAHVVAELLENALTFSPPDERVEVRGRHRDDRHYELAVVDRGFGMAAADITQANRRLSGSESFTIAPSKYLGHYVAGNLAFRHGIRIQLGETPGHGITASVELPPALLTTEAPVGDPITDPHGNRALGTRGGAAARAEAGPGTETGIGAGLGAGLGPGTEAGAGLGTGTGAGGGTGTGLGADAGAGLGTVAGADAGLGAGAGRADAGLLGGTEPAGTGLGADAAVGRGTGAGLGAGLGPGAGHRAGAEAGRGTEADLAAAPGAGPEAGAGLGAGPGGGAGLGAGAGAAGAGRADAGPQGRADVGGWGGAGVEPGGGLSGDDPGWSSPAGAPPWADDPSLPVAAGPPDPGGQSGAKPLGPWPAPGQARTEDDVAAEARWATTPGAPEAPAPPGSPAGDPEPGRAPMTGPSPMDPPPWASKPPADTPTRTASGLVKRSPLPREDESPEPTALTGDLLAALSDHTRRLGGQGPPANPPFGAPSGPSPFTAAPPPGGDQSPVWAFLDSALARPSPAPPRPRGRTGPQPGPPLDPASGGTTSSGLVRRVRGAQLPTTQPLSMRRDAGPTTSPPPPPPSPAPPPIPPSIPIPPGATGTPSAPAQDVYSFLTNFNAGVQRGLDESRGTEGH